VTAGHDLAGDVDEEPAKKVLEVHREAGVAAARRVSFAQRW
jgi:hypothetical protein